MSIKPRKKKEGSVLRTVMVLIFIFATAYDSPAQSFKYTVKHHHALRDCQGILMITPEGIDYESPRTKDSRKWKFEDIRVIEIKSPTQISLVTYEDQKRWMGKDKIFDFTLLDKKADPDLSAFLLSRIRKPMELSVLPEEMEKPSFEIAVKHLHTISGAMGVLRIYPDKVVFQSARVGDSRYWRFADIERFSQPDRFRFQIVGYNPKAGGPTEVYNFQLIDDLPAGVYDYLWLRLHPSSYYPEVKR
jgi:hypothetical protein